MDRVAYTAELQAKCLNRILKCIYNLHKWPVLCAVSLCLVISNFVNAKARVCKCHRNYKISGWSSPVTTSDVYFIVSAGEIIYLLRLRLLIWTVYWQAFRHASQIIFEVAKWGMENLRLLLYLLSVMGNRGYQNDGIYHYLNCVFNYRGWPL